MYVFPSRGPTVEFVEYTILAELPLLVALSNREAGVLNAARCRVIVVLVSVASLVAGVFVRTQSSDQRPIQGAMRWRAIGPYRGGRAKSVTGVPGHSNVFYTGFVNGGVWMTNDYGRTWKPIFDDQPTGSIGAIAVAPSDPNVIYVGSGEGIARPDLSTGGGIFKSTDGGTTWRPLTRGLPEDVVQADVAIAPSEPRRIYASVASRHAVGIYRSDDAGDSWTRITTDARPAGRIGGGDLPVPFVHPRNPDTVFMASVVTWRSIDGGKTWSGIRGAPGGDDYQRGWINPDDPDIIALASDQGTIISVNGGETWSSWSNQPTAQVYHVAADNAFPYRVCSGQQESGAACVSSRGNDGAITFREWHPVGVDEYGYAAPDPLSPEIIYGGRTPTRTDRRTGQVQNISPLPGGRGSIRTLRTAPVLFSPVDPHVLYFAGNTLWKTSTGGRSWTQISPDLSRKTFEIPANIGKFRNEPTAQPTERGVIYAVAPSPLDINRIWAGTDDGLIHVTTDGGAHWADVTPSDLKPFAKVSLIAAGHFSALDAYAAINTLRLDDLRPHIYRTHDGGKTWTHITTGIPDGGTINVVREDPKKKGLLYAGSEREVYVSFDDGEHWQSLRLNIAPSSVRDLIVKDDDLIAGTHGRGFWILDDITPLRQMDRLLAGADLRVGPSASGGGHAGPPLPAADVVLFKPRTAYRVRWNMNTDTPLPPDEAMGPNPPDGAIVNYSLQAASSRPVTLEILDS